MHLVPQPWERAAWAKMAARPACGHTQAGDGVSPVPRAPRFPLGLHAGRPCFQPLVPAIKGRAERSPPGQASRSPEAAWALAAILREASAACKMAAWA